MSKLGTLTTPKGATIDLVAASNGAVSVLANGKFVGMLDALVDTSAHGKVIKLKGVASVVAVGDASDLVIAAIAASKAIAAEKAQAAQAKWDTYTNTAEGKCEALMAKIAACDDDGFDRAEHPGFDLRDHDNIAK